MGPGRRRVLVAIAVLLPALLVYGARQIGSPVAAGDLPADAAPVFVGRVTPAQSYWSAGQPMRVTVEIRADRRIELAGIRVWVDDGQPTELRNFAVGPESRTVPFDVVFAGRGQHALVLQVRLPGGPQWERLPPTAQVIVA